MAETRSTLASLSDQLADTVDRAGASIVAVDARPRLTSTGIHWRDGVVVTTEGTVRRESEITVTLPSGGRAAATFAGRDRGTDLAVLKIPAGKLATAPLGDPTTLRPGQLVLALARFADGGPRAAFGAVSATGGPWRSWKGGRLDQWLQSDVSIYPGFGGGPLVDVEGRVHGVNSGALSRPLATTIPVATVDRVVTQILDRGYVARGWIGVAMQPVRIDERLRSRLKIERETGLLVIALESGAPAELAGLLTGDIILSVDASAVDLPEHLVELLTGDSVGKTLRLELLRGGARVTVEVLVGERPRRGR